MNLIPVSTFGPLELLMDVIEYGCLFVLLERKCQLFASHYSVLQDS